MGIFTELSIIIFVVVIVSVIMRFLKQPLVVGYIITGIIVGPYFLNILHSAETLELFSHIGIAILLFIVGLHLRPSTIKEVGSHSLFIGLGQVVLTAALGYLVTILLGFGPVPALYIATALTFSSTIIILKLLGDKGDLGALYGRISIGVLLVQDIIASLILISIGGLAQATGTATPAMMFGTIMGKALIVTAGLYLLVRYLFPRFQKFIGSSQELLFLLSLAWGLGVSAIFFYLGLSIEIGALIAGVAMSLSPFADEMSSRLKPLRDFFVVLFFVFLGSQVVLGDTHALLIPALVLSLFVLIGNPLIVIILMNLFGYRSRVGFMTGLTVAQVSEFSLILVALALKVGHIHQEIVSLVTFVALITIGISSYMILYSGQLYEWARPAIRFFEWRKVKATRQKHDNEYEAILFGYDRGGENFVQAIRAVTEKFLVIDISPNAVTKLKEKGHPYQYGDAEDPELVRDLAIERAKIIISTIPSFSINKLLLTRIRGRNTNASVIVVAATIAEAKALYENGATFVIIPQYLASQLAARLVSRHALNPDGFDAERERHIKHIDAEHAETIPLAEQL